MLEWIDAEEHEEVIDNDVMEALKELDRVAEAEDSDSNDNVIDKSNNVMDKSDEEDNEDKEPLISSFQAMSDVNEFLRYARSVRFIEADDFLLDKFERLARARQMKVTERAFLLAANAHYFFSRELRTIVARILKTASNRT